MLLGARQHQGMRRLVAPGAAIVRSPQARNVIVSMPVGVERLRCAAFAVDPAGVPASIMFLLPDREAVLYFIDDEPAGVEGFAAVGGADTHPHRHVGQIERSDPMNACGVLDGEAPYRLRQDSVALFEA